MLTRISTTLLIFIFVGLRPIHGQDPPASNSAPAPIATDRPALTNSSIVVPVGSLQAENGFLVTNLRRQNIADGSETLVRVGILARTAFRFTAPDYYYNLSGSGIGTGFGDLALGVKEQLGPLPGKFDASVTAFVSFPTGASGVSRGGYDPGLQVAWSRPLSSKWTTAEMLSLYGPTQDHSHNLTGESTLLLDWQLTALWDAFVEYVGDFPERGGTRQFVQSGTALKLGKRQQQQLDFHVGVGLTSAAVNHFIGVGYSFRFRAFHRE